MFISLLKNITGLMLILIAARCFAAELAPPPHQVMDKFGVNLSAGQVSTTIETLKIGGDLGLSHYLRTYSNNVVGAITQYSGGGFYSFQGFHDPFDGTARFEDIINSSQGGKVRIETYGRGEEIFYSQFYVMRVFDKDGSVDFKVKINGVVQSNASNCGSGCSYTYEAMGDIRNLLTVVDCEGAASVGLKNCLKWTKPDGAETYFYRGMTANPGPGVKGYLQKMVYPNGFIITVTSSNSGAGAIIYSVNTNTGFQLKYVYKQNTAPLDADKQSATNDPNLKADSLNWSIKNPRYIYGINNAIEYCNVEGLNRTDSYNVPECNFTHTWPKAEVIWPNGMPRALFIGNSKISIKNSLNLAADLNITAIDGSQESGVQFTVPRLISFKPAGATSSTVSYSYIAKYSCLICNSTFGSWVRRDVGEIGGASGTNGTTVYDMGHALSQGPNHYQNVSNGAGLKVVFMNDLKGGLYQVVNQDESWTFQQDYRNFVTGYSSSTSPVQAYVYDDINKRGNLVKITSANNLVVAEADYSASCSNPKTCNKPLWTTDAKGNKTYYTYHQASGALETVTYPANANQLVAQTRYEYAQKYAHVKDSSGARVQVSTPIWLKTAEKSCSNSNYTNGTCAGNDEVVTRYEYESDNLFMTGMTVYSQKDNKTLRTCYQYDIYGNRIGETQPKAGLASCN